jgi:hypothetical protein
MKTSIVYTFLATGDITKSKIEEIRELEASIEDLRGTAKDLCKTTETVVDPAARAQRQATATDLEASIEQMLAGPRGMKQAIQ